MKFTLEWFKAAAIRMIRTAAQVALGMITVGMIPGGEVGGIDLNVGSEDMTKRGLVMLRVQETDAAAEGEIKVYQAKH